LRARERRARAVRRAAMPGARQQRPAQRGRSSYRFDLEMGIEEFRAYVESRKVEGKGEGLQRQRVYSGRLVATEVTVFAEEAVDGRGGEGSGQCIFLSDVLKVFEGKGSGWLSVEEVIGELHGGLGVRADGEAVQVMWERLRDKGCLEVEEGRARRLSGEEAASEAKPGSAECTPPGAESPTGTEEEQKQQRRREQGRAGKQQEQQRHVSRREGGSQRRKEEQEPKEPEQPEERKEPDKAAQGAQGAGAQGEQEQEPKEQEPKEPAEQEDQEPKEPKEPREQAPTGEGCSEDGEEPRARGSRRGSRAAAGR